MLKVESFLHHAACKADHLFTPVAAIGSNWASIWKYIAEIIDVEKSSEWAQHFRKSMSYRIVLVFCQMTLWLCLLIETTPILTLLMLLTENY